MPSQCIARLLMPQIAPRWPKLSMPWPTIEYKKYIIEAQRSFRNIFKHQNATATTYLNICSSNTPLLFTFTEPTYDKKQGLDCSVASWDGSNRPQSIHFFSSFCGWQPSLHGQASYDEQHDVLLTILSAGLCESTIPACGFCACCPASSLLAIS